MSELLDAIFKLNIFKARKTPKQDLRAFIARFSDKYVAADLVRVGAEYDGGYLLPKIFEYIEYCFSPGVDYNSSFEAELSNKYGIKCFLADASVSEPALDNVNFDFEPKYLSCRTEGDYITLSQWINDKIGDDDGGKILQMDIEGAEYEVLTYESADTLAKFSVIIIEFHDFQNIAESTFLKVTSSIFEKLFTNFSICHAHPNNYGRSIKYQSFEIPSLLEVSFIRNDLLDHCKVGKPLKLPNELDRKNVPNRPPIYLEEKWWSKNASDTP